MCHNYALLNAENAKKLKIVPDVDSRMFCLEKTALEFVKKIKVVQYSFAKCYINCYFTNRTAREKV